MTADQPAEATQPRLWLGAAHPTDGDPLQVSLWGPEGDRYWGPEGNWWWATQVTDLRPAVVVPQREDEGEAALMRLGFDLAMVMTERPKLAIEADLLTVRRALAAQRPAAPVAVDEARAAYRALVHASLTRDLTAALGHPVGITADGDDGFALTTDTIRDLTRLAEIGRQSTQAAPVAVDEAAAARVAQEHRPCPCGCGACHKCDEEWSGTHVAEVVRALAARDEDGEAPRVTAAKGTPKRGSRDEDGGEGQ